MGEDALMPRVSIVLPNYNYARYLDERIRSILFQKYVDFELVIVDDASTDESLRVIESFNDARIRLHVRTQNSGKVYSSWNEGLRLCSGDLVLFAGADDAAERPMLARLVEPFDADPSLGFSHCRVILIDGEGRVMFTQMNLPASAAFIVEDLRRDYVAPAPLEWRRLLVTNFIWNASGVLFNRTALEDAGGFDDSLIIAADWLAYLQIARTRPVAYIGEPLNAFRQLSTSVSKRLQGAQLMDEIYTCVTRQKPHLRDAQDQAYYDIGMSNADVALQHYILLNTQAGNAEEVHRLVEVGARYGRGVRV